LSEEKKSKDSLDAIGLKNVKLFRNFIQYWLPVIILLGFMLWMSSGIFTYGYTATISLPFVRFLFPEFSMQLFAVLHDMARGLAHVIEYFILGLLLYRAVRSFYRGKWTWNWAIVMIAVLLSVAFFDEYYQSFFPMRNASLLDVGLNFTGGLISQLTIMLCLYSQSRKTRDSVSTT
jgi:VanZ family protein